MSFRSLAESLREGAQQVATFLRQERGFQRVRIEESVVEGLPKPTLHTYSGEGEIICVEFSEHDFYPQSLSRMVEDFRDAQVPVKFYIAVPSTAQSITSAADMLRARKQGIGIILIEPSGRVTVLEEAVSLLVTQLRRLTMADFPAPMRAHLAQAQSTFLSGNPPKGCSDVYDLLESVTRRIARAAASRGLWNGVPPTFDFTTEAWHNVCTSAYANMQFNNVGTLSRQLWANVLGVTRHRNETGHIPKTIQARRKRDFEMRTRFEHASDLLKDVLGAVKGFRF